MSKGLFITIEGIEGAGKTTAIQCMEEYLNTHNVEFVLTREPGGTEIAEAIRRVLLLEYYEEKMCEDTELLLMFASRAQHIVHVIKPALKEGKVVISDRFTDASFAYQGGGRGISEERIATLENWVQGKLKPDITVLLDVPAKVGLNRMKTRGDDLDRIEQERIEFFERVRQCYLKRAEQYSNQYRVIDASVTIDEMKASVTKLMDQLLNER